MTEYVFGQMRTIKSTLPEHLGYGRIRGVCRAVALRLTASQRVQPSELARPSYA